MGSGYGANAADVIEEKDIKKVGKCKKLFAALEDALGEEFGIDDLAQQIQSNGDIDSAIEEMFPAEEGRSEIENQSRAISGNLVKTAYEGLCSEFKKLTGLTIELSYHSQEDDGDRYDDVSGAYWDVWGWYCVSPQAKKAQKKYKIKVETKGFVTFG